MSIVLQPSKNLLLPTEFNNWCTFFNQGFYSPRVSPFMACENINSTIPNPQSYSTELLQRTSDFMIFAIDWTHQTNYRYLNESAADSSKNAIQDKSYFYTADREVDLTRTKRARIWRPFSPSPPRKSFAFSENKKRSKHKLTDRMTFHSITPSNVKIGFSKTSVFKSVKKKSYCCSQCSSRYVNVAQLNSHMRVHTGMKPYSCEHPNCSKSFARNEELTRHRRIHSGYKPHLCPACNKRFGRKDHLSKHLKTHLQVSEKKVYVCSISGCGHRYTRSDALTRHKSTAHAIKKLKGKA